MRYKLLGRSGLRVSEICLGTMTFGTEWGWGADKEASKLMFDAYANAGGNFIDTANRYTEGTSERYVGEFIAADREHFVLATKYTLKMRDGDPNFSGNHRKNMMQAVEASLKRLNTDYIDLYWLHAWDFTTQPDEVMRGLEDLVRSGKVLYVGVSDTPAWVVAQCNTLADLRGWTPFVGLQIEYSLLQRTVERELIPMSRSLDLGVLAWAPLAGGALTGRYLNGLDASGRIKEGSARLNDRATAIVREVVAVAEEIGRPATQVALNWLRQQPGVVIPLVGARKVEQLEQSLACVDFRLSDDHMARLSTASAIELGFPMDFLTGKGVQDILFGGTQHLLDSHRTFKV